MKNSKIVSLMLMFSFLFICSCEKDENPIDDYNNVEFIAYYKPSSEKVLGEDKMLAKLSVSNGATSYASFLDVYPDNSLVADSDIDNNVLAMGLFWRDFDNQGMYMNLDDNEYNLLPLVAPPQDDDYSYFSASTADVTENGYIIYISATNDINYGDQYRPHLVRYDKDNDKLAIADGVVAFALSQPEKGGDTDFAQVNRNIFASTDGRYAFGHMEAYGTEGGGIHWDYNILFKYDFENGAFTRLGDIDDYKVTIHAMTEDRKYLIYTNNYQMKVLNVETGYITESEMNLVNVGENSWNNYGACVGATSGNLYYKDFANNNEVTVCSPGGSPKNTMFSKDGSKIYFTLKGYEEKYLCVTDGITEGSNYDTLGAYPLEFYDIVLIK